MKTPSLDKVQELVTRLYNARLEFKTAKTEFHRNAKELGECQGADITTANYEPFKCYLTKFNKDVWCRACTEKLPYWEDYRKKSYASSAALKALIWYEKRRQFLKQKNNEQTNQT